MAKGNPYNLTDKQKRFCEEYMIDLNATQAAIRAGYSEKTASESGYENLRKPQIENYIQDLKKDVSERNKITVDECVQILANIARNDIADYYDEKGNLKDIHSIPKESRDAIEEMTSYEEKYEGQLLGHVRKIKSSGKQAAIDKLLKHLGGYKEDNSQKQTSVNIFQLPDNGR